MGPPNKTRPDLERSNEWNAADRSRRVQAMPGTAPVNWGQTPFLRDQWSLTPISCTLEANAALCSQLSAARGCARADDSRIFTDRRSCMAQRLSRFDQGRVDA